MTETFELSVEGIIVPGPQDLPDGTEITFSEATAPTVAAHQWHEVAFTLSSAVVDDGQIPTVTVTNKYSNSPAVTGLLTSTWAVLIAGRTLLGLGTVALLLPRRM